MEKGEGSHRHTHTHPHILRLKKTLEEDKKKSTSTLTEKKKSMRVIHCAPPSSPRSKSSPNLTLRSFLLRLGNSKPIVVAVEGTRRVLVVALPQHQNSLLSSSQLYPLPLLLLSSYSPSTLMSKRKLFPLLLE